MVTQIIFTGLVTLLAVQRAAEMRLSKKNEARMAAKGGQEHYPGHFKVMKLLHFTWFISMLAEVFFLKRPLRPALAGAAALVFAVGQSLRYAAIRKLDWRWSVRIFTLHGEPPVTEGIYRYIRHPNYLGVILEVAAVPLLHNAYLTALCFSLANAILLSVRIHKEEEALEIENSYETSFSGQPRFLPRRI